MCRCIYGGQGSTSDAFFSWSSCCFCDKDLTKPEANQYGLAGWLAGWQTPVNLLHPPLQCWYYRHMLQCLPLGIQIQGMFAQHCCSEFTSFQPRSLKGGNWSSGHRIQQSRSLLFLASHTNHSNSFTYDKNDSRHLI